MAEMIGGELELVTVLGQLSGAHHDPWDEKKRQLKTTVKYRLISINNVNL